MGYAQNDFHSPSKVVFLLHKQKEKLIFFIKIPWVYPYQPLRKIWKYNWISNFYFSLLDQNAPHKKIVYKHAPIGAIGTFSVSHHQFDHSQSKRNIPKADFKWQGPYLYIKFLCVEHFNRVKRKRKKYIHVYFQILRGGW